ncbi:MAG: SLC13 family permease [Phycisphaerales bacterium]|jgi:sodium-dependent dicarboxylate transporter 2/3/5|nr:DASS family sodium-coupled anion symporter [Phycisphaeraceae bacterium]
MDQAHTSPTAKLAGLICGPALACGLALTLSHTTSLPDPAIAVAAVAMLMAVWWITEALPLAATSLLPIALLPLFNVGTIRQVCAPYGNEVVFLFMGGFMLQQAMERWNLHRRVALALLLVVGDSPARLIAGMMLACAFLSMWISNAATSAMMLPIGLSICAVVIRQGSPSRADADADPFHALPHRSPKRNFCICMMLAIAYAATIGGLGTPIGTAPNMLMLAQAQRQFGIRIDFIDWMLMAMPLVIALLVITFFVLTRLVYPVAGAMDQSGDRHAARAAIRRQLADLGPLSLPEVITLIVFVLMAIGWAFQSQICSALGMFTVNASGAKENWLTDAGVAIIGALLLFIIPVKLSRTRLDAVLDWHHASKLPFGVLLLFGGGLSLADAVDRTGLAAAIGSSLQSLNVPSVFLLILIITTLAIFLSELVSNTALVATFVGIFATAAGALGVHPLLLMLPLTLGASTAFMLPAGTPPNAIVFSSGYLTIGSMARPGLILNLVSAVLVTLTATALASWALGINLLVAP